MENKVYIYGIRDLKNNRIGSFVFDTDERNVKAGIKAFLRQDHGSLLFNYPDDFEIVKAGEIDQQSSKIIGYSDIERVDGVRSVLRELQIEELELDSLKKEVSERESKD